MKRKIEYKVSGGGRVLPSARQWGGMQYEDNATELVFDISDTEVKKEGILWRIDFNSSAAGYNPSETLTVEGGKVKRLLPYDMTRCGGEIQVTLIGTEVDGEDKELSIAYSVPVTVYLTDVEQHEESAKEMAPRISAAEASAVDAAKRAKQSEEAAAESAEIAEEAKLKTEEARFALEEGATFVFQGGDAKSENEVDLVVDGELSEVSENPVQNKVVSKKLKEMAAAAGKIVAVGTIFPFAGEKAPDTFMICDGSALDVTEYPELFDVIGYSYGGEGDTFNLPDLRGRAIVGQNPADNDFNKIGKTDGEKEHKLTVEEMPSHTHNLYGSYTTTINISGGASYAKNGWIPNLLGETWQTGGAILHTGGEAAHNNMPPYSVCNFIIKVCKGVSTGISGGASVVFPEDSTSGSIGAEIVVDQELSAVSDNPVSNKAVTIPLRAAQNDIKNLQENVRIIESGTSGIWTYRVWSDGTAECWGTQSSCDATPWDSMMSMLSVKLPVAFVGVPSITCSGYQQATAYSYVTMATAENNAANAYMKCTNEPNETYPCWFNFYVIGKRG